MGLRFRKSVSILPGVRLNFGKTGMSVSAGVPGFRKTFHTSGRVTTSVGIPGTGIYYVDTKKPRGQADSTSLRKSDISRSQVQSTPYTERSELGRQASYDVWEAYSESEISSPTETSSAEHVPINHIQVEEENHHIELMQLDTVTLKSIHKVSDDTIDWTEVLVSPVAPDDTYNQEMWKYYHSVAGKVLSGDIDT